MYSWGPRNVLWSSEELPDLAHLLYIIRAPGRLYSDLEGQQGSSPEQPTQPQEAVCCCDKGLSFTSPLRISDEGRYTIYCLKSTSPQSAVRTHTATWWEMQGCPWPCRASATGSLINQNRSSSVNLWILHTHTHTHSHSHILNDVLFAECTGNPYATYSSSF
jgi:hypothetical protein